MYFFFCIVSSKDERLEVGSTHLIHIQVELDPLALMIFLCLTLHPQLLWDLIFMPAPPVFSLISATEKKI